MLDTIFGALIGVALASDGGITVKTVDLHEKAQIDKVLEIANTINFLGRTLPADTDDWATFTVTVFEVTFLPPAVLPVTTAFILAVPAFLAFNTAPVPVESTDTTLVSELIQRTCSGPAFSG